MVQEILVNEGYEVDLLKEFDPRLNDYRALALVSIHNDSCVYVNDQATGYKVAAAPSSRFPEKATRLTACLSQRYKAITGMSFHYNTVTRDMTEYHAFNEIHSDTTAAIIETGFMNLDREILVNRTDVVATGVASGILCYVRNEDIPNVPVMAHERKRAEAAHCMQVCSKPRLPYARRPRRSAPLASQAARLDPASEQPWLLLASIAAPQASVAYLQDCAGEEPLQPGSPARHGGPPPPAQRKPAFAADGQTRQPTPGCRRSTAGAAGPAARGRRRYPPHPRCRWREATQPVRRKYGCAAAGRTSFCGRWWRSAVVLSATLLMAGLPGSMWSWARSASAGREPVAMWSSPA
jgi:hypothetical protein